MSYKDSGTSVLFQGSFAEDIASRKYLFLQYMEVIHLVNVVEEALGGICLLRCTN